VTIQQLYYFLKIADLGSYTKAADLLYVSQPTLSYAIKEMEKDLGVSLFQKLGRNIYLTQYGETFYKHTKVMLKEMEDAKEDINTIINPVIGGIKLSHVSSIKPTFIPNIVKEFYKRSEYKGVKFFISETPTKDIVENIINGITDVGFGSKVDNPGIMSYPIYSEDLVLIVNKNHFLASRDEIDLKEIEKYKIIAYCEQCGIRKQIDQLFLEAGIKQNILCEVVDNIQVTGFVAVGLGIAIVPAGYGDKYFNVKSLKITSANATRTMYMLWSKEHIFSHATKKFIEFVKTYAAYLKD
jgi:DNA-binding transcriptional LysR family regulator